MHTGRSNIILIARARVLASTARRVVRRRMHTEYSRRVCIILLYSMHTVRARWNSNSLGEGIRARRVLASR